MMQIKDVKLHKAMRMPKISHGKVKCTVRFPIFLSVTADYSKIY